MQVNDDYKSGYIYLETDYFKEEKEVFKFVFNTIKKDLGEEEISILDYCGARGEFIYHAAKRLNSNRLVAFDFDPNLVESGQEYIGNAELLEGDAKTFDYPYKEFDVTTILGSISLFDDLNVVLDNMKSHTRAGGYIYIFGKVNPNGMDVRLTYRNHVMGLDWQKSNYHSFESISEIAKNLELQIIRNEVFEYSRDDKPQKDPLRAWTENISNKKMFMNGTGMVYDLTLIVMKKL